MKAATVANFTVIVTAESYSLNAYRYLAILVLVLTV